MLMSSDFAIKVENLSKSYRIYDKPRDRLLQAMPWNKKQYFHEFWALKDVSFEVKKGETVGIIGRNGSGKSTLLQLICGTLTPTSGSIKTNGRVAALLELGAGFNPEFTGRENVYMNASILGLSKDEIDARFECIVDFADIGEFVDQPVKTYSSGMMVRLAFAVIAHVDADILVIDEALAVGDAFFVQKCMRFLRKFMESGTVLFVSHDTAAVINFCNSAIWLSKGNVKYQGPPKIAAQKYLEDLHGSQRDKCNIEPSMAKEYSETVQVQMRDMRLDFINSTQFRNDIELFSFTSEVANFGAGGATIENVRLLDSECYPLSWVVGGEKTRLEITCKANTELTSPIVGFLVKDRLGQDLFGDNTYLTYALHPKSITTGQPFCTYFEFIMPTLPVGDYSITVAVAEGSQQDHILHHWIHDALLLKSNSSSVSTGLVGIPMSNIVINLL